jgi:hypothetical protein
MDMRIQGFSACAELMADAEHTAGEEEQRVKENMPTRPRHVCPGRLGRAGAGEIWHLAGVASGVGAPLAELEGSRPAVRVPVPSDERPVVS